MKDEESGEVEEKRAWEGEVDVWVGRETKRHVGVGVGEEASTCKGERRRVHLYA